MYDTLPIHHFHFWLSPEFRHRDKKFAEILRSVPRSPMTGSSDDLT